MKKDSIRIILTIVLVLLVGCNAKPPDKFDEPTTIPIPNPEPLSEETPMLPTLGETSSFSDGTFLGITYQRPDGNRLVNGKGTLPDVQPLQITLDGRVQWLVGVPYQEGVLWTAVLMDGTVETVLSSDNKAEKIDFGWGPLPLGTPPLVMVQDGEPHLVSPPTDKASPDTHPVILDPIQMRLAYLEKGGDLVIWEDRNEISRLPVDGLPDARILKDERDRLLLLSNPTDRYAHGVLGDALEAGRISLIETAPELKLIQQIEIPAPGVIEGISPIWVDLNGDDVREILVTVSDETDGARLVVYSETGELLAEGPRAGQGYRWRHQLAAVPLHGGSELVVFDVVRPHLDAIFEVYRWRGEYLTVMVDIPGYSTHSIGSRNLDQTLAGDFDGDGVVEVIVPDQFDQRLSGIAYQDDALGVVWSLPLDGELSSNLAGVTLPDGSLILGAGVGETLFVWQ